MKKLAFIFVFVSSISAFSQNGYIILSNDSIIYGYVKTLTSISGEPEVELWKTMKDKNPTRYERRALKEYAIKKDTFRIFHNLEAYNNYLVTAEAKRIVGGKIQLYFVFEIVGFHFLYDLSKNSMSEKIYFGTHLGTGINKVNSDFDKIISDFLNDDVFIHHYAAKFGNSRSLNIRKPKDLKELVHYYNTSYKK